MKTLENRWTDGKTNFSHHNCLKGDQLKTHYGKGLSDAESVGGNALQSVMLSRSYCWVMPRWWVTGCHGNCGSGSLQVSLDNGPARSHVISCSCAQTLLIYWIPEHDSLTFFVLHRTKKTGVYVWRNSNPTYNQNGSLSRQETIFFAGKKWKKNISLKQNLFLTVWQCTNAEIQIHLRKVSEISEIMKLCLNATIRRHCASS